MCPSNYNCFSDRARYWSKIVIFHTPLHSVHPLGGGGFPSEHRHPVWHGKTRMAWLPPGKKISKISLFILAQITNVTDRQTDGNHVPAYTALMHMHRTVKMAKTLFSVGSQVMWESSVMKKQMQFRSQHCLSLR